MSVSTERTCTTPTSSEDSGVYSFKLKRRWIEMNSGETEDELDSPLDLSLKRVKHSEARYKGGNYVSGKGVDKSILLPGDPRVWSKKQVLEWLRYMHMVYEIDVAENKFDMNGKALCLMNMQMFVRRVPLGGKMLYKDFRLRLHKAISLTKTLAKSSALHSGTSLLNTMQMAAMVGVRLFG